MQMQLSLPVHVLSTALHHCSETATGSNAAFCIQRPGQASCFSLQDKPQQHLAGNFCDSCWGFDQPQDLNNYVTVLRGGYVHQIQEPGWTHALQ